MSLAPPFEDEGRRCFIYCGDDRCTCGAATQRIVEHVTSAFLEDLSRILGEAAAARAKPAR